MNGNAPGSAEPRNFFASVLTKGRKTAIGLLLVAAVGGATLSGRWLMASSAEARKIRPAEAPAASVRVVDLHDETVLSGIRYSAVVKELRKAELSFRVGGTVEFLAQQQGPGGQARDVHEGDMLKQGEVIARLDPADYRRERSSAAGRLAMAQAKLAQTKADAELAVIEFNRTQQLRSQHAVSSSEQDTARNKLKTTAANENAAAREVETAEVTLSQAEANLDYCTLKIPFPEGTVSSRFLNRDERVMAGQKAFLVVDVSSVVIAFMVPDTLVGRLAIGQPVEVNTDALPGHHFEGVIHKIANSADAQTRTYPIEVRVDRPEGLRPGMVANVHFRHEQRAHLLPLTAIAPGSSGTRGFEVYRVDAEGGKWFARRVPVVLDSVVDNRVAVKIGPDQALKPGDRVVSTGIHRLFDGQAVQVVE